MGYLGVSRGCVGKYKGTLGFIGFGDLTPTMEESNGKEHGT